MNILVLMAGSAPDFEKNGFSYPKYLAEIQSKPIIQRIIESLRSVSSNISCAIRKEDQDKFFLGDTLKIICPGCRIIEVAGNTKGAACTALFGIEYINNDEELLIVNGDQLIKADVAKAIDNFRARKLDGGIVTINTVHPKYSSVLLDEGGLVVQTSEKRPISNIASTGCCYFRKGADFVDAAFAVIEKDASTQGMYYISATFNELILNQKRIGVFEIPRKDYISFSTYQMYENYLTHRRGDND